MRAIQCRDSEAHVKRARNAVPLQRAVRFTLWNLKGGVPAAVNLNSANLIRVIRFVVVCNLRRVILRAGEIGGGGRERWIRIWQSGGPG